MFDLSVAKMVVLALVGLIVIGPDNLPAFTRNAARLLRTLRDMATGAREQLRDELGPEFAEIDLSQLNPRTIVRQALFDDEDFPSVAGARAAVRNALFADDTSVTSTPPSAAWPGIGTAPADDPEATTATARPRPRPAPPRG